MLASAGSWLWLICTATSGPWFGVGLGTAVVGRGTERANRNLPEPLTMKLFWSSEKSPRRVNCVMLLPVRPPAELVPSCTGSQPAPAIAMAVGEAFWMIVPCRSLTKVGRAVTPPGLKKRCDDVETKLEKFASMRLNPAVCELATLSEM